MIHFTCDWCNNTIERGREQAGHANNEYKLFLKRDKQILKAEVIIALNGSYNSANICNICIRELLRNGTP